MGKDAYYFSHDSNARHDEKILAMRSVYGGEGYGWYWMLIEMMRDANAYRLQCEGKYWVNVLAQELRIEPAKAKEFIDDCIKEFELFVSDSKNFWSESLLRRMEKKEYKSLKAKESANSRWRNAMQSESEGNANASKNDAIKESKVKEIKEKKVFVPPTLDEVKKYFSENGFNEQTAIRAFQGYDVADWHDSQGKKVRSWKQKMTQVWFKDENKIIKQVAANSDRSFGQQYNPRTGEVIK